MERFSKILLVWGVVIATFMLSSIACADDFLRISGDEFVLNGQVHKIKGANYYPASAPWGAWFNEWPWDEMVRDIDKLASLGINTVRLNLPYSTGGWNGPNVPTLYLDRLERLVELCRSRGIKCNITLFDWETSFPAAGTQKEAEHKEYIRKIVTRLRNNPGVFMWDVKNEPDHPDNIGGYDNWDNNPTKRDQIISWLQRMCAAVKDYQYGNDTEHAVTAGIRWYENTVDVVHFVDVAIFHSYWPNIGTPGTGSIATIQAATGKPIVVQEFGWPSQPYPCWRDMWVYDYTEQRQLEVFQINIDAFHAYDIAGGLMWQACDLAPYVPEPNTDKSITFENYFGLWKIDYSLKPAAYHYRDNWPSDVFSYSDSTVPSPVTGVNATGYDRMISLTWTNSASSDCAGVVVRCSTSGYPTSPAAGDLVADIKAEGTSPGSAIKSGLDRDTTYYFSLFAYDYAGNYSIAAYASAHTLAQPENLLQNALINSFSSGVATGWIPYEVYPSGDSGPVVFSSDTQFSTTGGVSQKISGFGASELPSQPGAYAHAGIVQNVPATPGKVYLLVGNEKLTASKTSPWYFRTFGIDPTGSTSPGSPGASNISGAYWCAPDVLVWNNDPNSSNSFPYMFRCISAATAESDSISCWAGLGISLVDGRSTNDKINYDSFYLHEFDNPVNLNLQNSNFDETVFDCIDADIHLPNKWLPVGGSYGMFAGFDVNTDQAYAMSGSQSVMLLCTKGRADHGLMQRVQTCPGETLNASVYVRGTSGGNPTTSAAIGIDPTGGTDLFADSVVWSSTCSVGSNIDWTQMSVSALAESSSATVFIIASSGTDSAGYHTVFADNASFSVQTIAASPSDLKSLPDSRPVAIDGCIVTAAFSGYFYMEDTKRTSGIRVTSSVPVSVGKKVNVIGTIGTIGGERHISASSVDIYTGTYPVPSPYAVPAPSLGGADISSYTFGVDNGVGPNNIGLLIVTWGKVLDSNSTYFTIEGGRGGSVKVYSTSNPAIGSLAVVTGVSGCDITNEERLSVVRTRTTSDVVTY